MQAVRLRVHVRVHRWRIDHELAASRGRADSNAFALRASQLATPNSRRRIARALRATAVSARRRHPGPLCSAVPLRPGAEQWGEALVGLAERLERPVALNVCGIARALEFLSDGAGPLYNSNCAISIEDAIWRIADGLALCPPHAWGCPVTMKIDPGHVAWTCSRCGAIATTGDQAVRPA